MVTPEEAREMADQLDPIDDIYVSLFNSRCADALLDLAAQVEALQADAERYRWLKSEEAYEGWLPGWYDGAGYGRHSFHFKTEIEDLDAAIDAARKDQP